AELRVAPVPATPPSPPQVPTEPVKATPPAAPPSPRVAAVTSGGVGSRSVSAEVQPHRRTYRVGWLDSGRATAQYQEIVKQALVGYPREVAFEYRSADGQTARLQGFAAELVQLNVVVVFTVGNQAIQAAKQATTAIPIVMLGSDAVRRDESNANMAGRTDSSAELALGWPRRVRAAYSRPVPPRGRLYRQDPRPDEAAGPPDRAAVPVRARRQSQDRPGARAHASFVAGPSSRPRPAVSERGLRRFAGRPRSIPQPADSRHRTP